MPSLKLNGLILDLSLDAITTDGKVLDESGQANHALVTGPVTVVDDPVLGNCLDFPGGEAFLTLKDPFPNNVAFSICLWVKPAALADGGFQGIIGTKDDTVSGPSLLTDPSNRSLRWDSFESSPAEPKDGSVEYFFSGPGEWDHVCWVNDGTTHSVSRNGALMRTSPAPATFYRAKSSYFIGKLEKCFKGRLARVRVFDRAIGPDELAQIITNDREHQSAPQTEEAIPVNPDNSEPPNGDLDGAALTSMTGTELQELAYKAGHAFAFAFINGLIDGARAAGGTPPTLTNQDNATFKEAAVVRVHQIASRRR